MRVRRVVWFGLGFGRALAFAVRKQSAIKILIDAIEKRND